MITPPRTLTAVLVAGLVLVACGTDEPAAPTDTATEDTTADDVGGVDDGTGDGGDAAGGDSQPATVTLSIDGGQVPVVEACNRADGGVEVATQDDVRVTLVKEDGDVLRWENDGATAETDEVEVEEVGVFTIHRGTIESGDVPAVFVELELGDTSVLDDC